MKKMASLLGVGLVGFLAACATIMHGTRQDVSISSNPTGATVTIDGQSKGKAPLVADLKRKNNHLIKIELPGYAPFEMWTTTKVSGWVWGNIVFGGLIGLAVDAISGGLYKVTPEQIAATLNKQEKQAATLYNDGTLYIVTVLKPNPSWEKIGSLQRLPTH
ncbi:MAG: PEGA domain-containing protein [Elusimicrobia bacterium]|nr:PEGA domain-containing protein [Elusimicrobiota bacterium]